MGRDELIPLEQVLASLSLAIQGDDLESIADLPNSPQEAANGFRAGIRRSSSKAIAHKKTPSGYPESEFFRS